MSLAEQDQEDDASSGFLCKTLGGWVWGHSPKVLRVFMGEPGKAWEPEGAGWGSRVCPVKEFEQLLPHELFCLFVYFRLELIEKTLSVSMAIIQSCLVQSLLQAQT